MWGSEMAEGKVTATLGIAGECVKSSDRSRLTCQFASIGMTQDGQCLVSTWSERLRLVQRTSEVITWAGTQGPEGLAGAMAASTLVAERSPIQNSKADLFNTYGPGPFDRWTYKSTTSYSAPGLVGRALPTTTAEVKSSADSPTLRCKSTGIIAISP
jgi:hypothetical protein